MKINEPGRIGMVNAYQKHQEQASDAGPKAKRTDKVQISAEAHQLLSSSKVDTAAKAERMQSLKHEVATGTYYVDASKIAEKLVSYFKPDGKA
ncbi:flagellar biosynthesis anti-sigma factor FlgM [Paenibacillus sp. IB182496]|uniref:Negative regulator of flagellin synthesis n=1 Tax=Paenibacillus sabuli TaxID=2772509 RepID=A0A927GSM1_9BACL|nr:flagellar biosynthesis anti-sigma factor FlgM [Paenibacillus sabuli]MBD2845837.1 flagellar biosynthesis anti-sigma factor FlgM [Paenibacillus sabuli]